MHEAEVRTLNTEIKVPAQKWLLLYLKETMYLIVSKGAVCPPIILLFNSAESFSVKKSVFIFFNGQLIPQLDYNDE